MREMPVRQCNRVYKLVANAIWPRINTSLFAHHGGFWYTAWPVKRAPPVRRAAYERAWNGLNEIVRRHPDSERILVVSHNFPILGIVCRISGTHLNDYRTFHLDPCGVTRLNHDGARGWTITHVNSREYPAGSPASQI